jgi:hypothetical protein
MILDGSLTVIYRQIKSCSIFKSFESGFSFYDMIQRMPADVFFSPLMAHFVTVAVYDSCFLPK